jgi:hypothetical protein
MVSVDLVPTSGDKVAPRTKLSAAAVCRIGWSDQSQLCLQFEYKGSGNVRDTWVAEEKPWVLKCQLLEKGVDNNSKKEWASYNEEPRVQALTPRIYGYMEEIIAGKNVACLLMQQVAFTYAELMERLCKHPVNKDALQVVAYAALKIVETMSAAARNGLALHDWHVRNVGFLDSKAVRIVLIDWEGNLRAPTTPLKARMAPAFEAFHKYLPGPHTYGSDPLEQYSVEVQQARLGWTKAMTAMAEALQKWWAEADFHKSQLPTEIHFIQLETALWEVVGLFDPARDWR